MRFRFLVVTVLSLVFMAVIPSAAANESVNIDWEKPSGVVNHKVLKVDFKVKDWGHDHFFAQTFDISTGGGGYVGLRRDQASGDMHVKFSMWRNAKNGQSADFVSVKKLNPDATKTSHRENGNGWQVQLPMNWEEGVRYTLHVERTSHIGFTDTWSAWISWDNDLRRVWIASISLIDDSYDKGVIFDTGTFVEYVDSVTPSCTGPVPEAELRVYKPRLGYKHLQFERKVIDCPGRGSAGEVAPGSWAYKIQLG